MIIGRRTFILRTGLVAAAPALANLLSRSALARPPSLPRAEPLPSQPSTGATSANGPVLRIDGWDLRDDAPMVSDGGEVWINLSRSWRTAWR